MQLLIHTTCVASLLYKLPLYLIYWYLIHSPISAHLISSHLVISHCISCHRNRHHLIMLIIAIIIIMFIIIVISLLNLIRPPIRNIPLIVTMSSNTCTIGLQYWESHPHIIVWMLLWLVGQTWLRICSPVGPNLRYTHKSMLLVIAIFGAP